MQGYVSSDSRLNQVIFSCRIGDNSQMLDTIYGKMLVSKVVLCSHSSTLFKYICARRKILGTLFLLPHPEVECPSSPAARSLWPRGKLGK